MPVCFRAKLFTLAGELIKILKYVSVQNIPRRTFSFTRKSQTLPPVIAFRNLVKKFNIRFIPPFLGKISKPNRFPPLQRNCRQVSNVHQFPSLSGTVVNLH
ncbi:hypothetical protein HanIR_Chr03g0128371 [Helianthus annuus]|nr:hypothetical protein HanIR_Chr03g0128371 [Helianthus annuus]